MQKSLSEIAENLDRAAEQATAVQQISNFQDLSLTEAYRIQDYSIDRRLSRDEKITGIKLGFTSRAKMEQMGVHELIWGRLTDAMEYQQKDVMDITNFIHPRAEPEIAFLLAKDITDEITLENARSYIESIAGAIEIIDSRFENFKFSLADVIADNCSSSGYVIGDWHGPETEVRQLNIELSINNEVVQKGSSDAILGNPLESLVEASQLCKKYGQPLKKGMIVLAGAATPASYFKKGDHIVARIQELGEIRINA